MVKMHEKYINHRIDIMNRNRFGIFIGVTGIVLIFAFFIVLRWKLGYFDFTGEEARANIIASTIALVGVLISSLVAIFGYFIKNSLDQRNTNLKEEAERRLKIDSDRNNNLREEAERRLKIESERNNNLREEAEGRLKLEAGLQAIKLLSTGSGTAVPLTQRAGVLFTLAHLKQSDLAITMLGQMLPKGSIDAKTAAWLINHVLESYLKDLKDRSLKGLSIEATRLLDENYNKFLVAKGYYEFPRCLNLKWNPKLPKLAKRNAALALLRMTVHRRCTDWKFDAMNLVIASLILKWQNETDDEIRNGVGICLKIIIELREDYILHLPSGKIEVNKIRSELKKITHFRTTTEFENLSELMKKWIYCGKGCVKIKCVSKCGKLGQHRGKHKCDSCGHEW